MGVDHEGQKDPKDLDVAELEDAGSLPTDTDESSCEDAEGQQEQELSEDEGESQDSCEDVPEKDAPDSENDSEVEAVEENADVDSDDEDASNEAADEDSTKEVEQSEEQVSGEEPSDESTGDDPCEDGIDADSGNGEGDTVADGDASETPDGTSGEGGEPDVSDEEGSSSGASSLDQLKANASTAFARGKDALRTARTWCGGHAGASVAIGTCVALAVIAGGFAIGANVLISHIDADFEARAEERLAQEKKEEEEILPRIGMRFTSFSHSGFPAISASLTMYSSDGSPLPALTAEQFTLVEVDGNGAEASVGITGLTFDPASGACQLTYNADTATLGGDRTVRINLTEESGYQGGASMSYRV